MIEGNMGIKDGEDTQLTVCEKSEMGSEYGESWCVPAKVTSRCEQSLP